MKRYTVTFRCDEDILNLIDLEAEKRRIDRSNLIREILFKRYESELVQNENNGEYGILPYRMRYLEGIYGLVLISHPVKAVHINDS